MSKFVLKSFQSLLWLLLYSNVLMCTHTTIFAPSVMAYTFRIDVHVSPKFYTKRKREICCIVEAAVSREKVATRAKQACVSQEWPNELEALISTFVALGLSAHNERIEAAGAKL